MIGFRLGRIDGVVFIAFVLATCAYTSFLVERRGFCFS